MRFARSLGVGIVFAVALTSAEFANAQSEDTTQSSPLLGEWTLIQHHIEMFDGTRVGDFDAVMTFNEQSGDLARGQYNLTIDSGTVHDGDSTVTEREIDVIAVVSRSGNEVKMITTGEKDGWHMEGVFLTPDLLEIIAYEPGEHGWLARKVYMRGQ